jgi:hypothetical protein
MAGSIVPWRHSCPERVRGGSRWKIAGLAATFSPVEKVKSLSPRHRFVIALRSPDGVFETGLPIALREKGVRGRSSSLRRGLTGWMYIEFQSGC